MLETCDEPIPHDLLQVMETGSAVDLTERLWRPNLLRLELGSIAGIDDRRGLIQSISIFTESCHINRGVVLYRVGDRIAERDQQPSSGQQR